MSKKEIKLTSMVKTSGCAAKLPPGVLAEVLSRLPIMEDENLVKGYAGNEDALVYDLGDNKVMVATVDFFPPMVDDPKTFGRIAAANALSDVFAMGCKPAVALNLLCFPSCIDTSYMEEILLGGQEKAREAKAVIAGGHTISDPTPKYGLCVIGFGDLNKVWKNQGAKPGDVLILTKKIGTGVAMTALKGELCEEETAIEAIESMQTLNENAYKNALDLEIHAATDVTGFSLLGHSLEMAGSNDITINIDSNKVPFMKGVLELARMGLLPEGMYNNRDYIEKEVEFDSNIPLEVQDMLFDPQTSGGLLFAMSKEDSKEYLSRMKGKAWEIGYVSQLSEKSIKVF